MLGEILKKWIGGSSNGSEDRTLEKLMKTLENHMKANNRRNFPHMGTPPESGLDNIWEELCVQLQREPSQMFSQYMEIMNMEIDYTLSECFSHEEVEKLIESSKVFYSSYPEKARPNGSRTGLRKFLLRKLMSRGAKDMTPSVQRFLYPEKLMKDFDVKTQAPKDIRYVEEDFPDRYYQGLEFDEAGEAKFDKQIKHSLIKICNYIVWEFIKLEGNPDSCLTNLTPWEDYCNQMHSGHNHLYDMYTEFITRMIRYYLMNDKNIFDRNIIWLKARKFYKNKMLWDKVEKGKFINSNEDFSEFSENMTKTVNFVFAFVQGVANLYGNGRMSYHMFVDKKIKIEIDDYNEKKRVYRTVSSVVNERFNVAHECYIKGIRF